MLWLSVMLALAGLAGLAHAVLSSEEPWRRFQSLAGGVGMFANSLLFSPIGRGRARLALAIVAGLLLMFAGTASFWR